MALVYCPDCDNQSSDQAVACVKCGYPIAKLKQSTTSTQKQSQQNSFAKLDYYYQQEFEQIQKTDEDYRGKFNWYAFFFSWIWLLTKGAWSWAIIVFVANWLAGMFLMKTVKGEIGIIPGLLAMIGISITLGHNATKIYYNVRVKNIQF